jgi:hypothetical protein
MGPVILLCHLAWLCESNGSADPQAESSINWLVSPVSRRGITLTQPDVKSCTDDLEDVRHQSKRSPVRLTIHTQAVQRISYQGVGPEHHAQRW